MNTIYSNLKKVALSLLVVGLAISTQAFKSVSSRSVIKYYKVDIVNHPDADDPQGYAYYSDMDRCEPLGDLCSAEWDLGLNPTPTIDGTPLPTSGVTFQTGTVEAGRFD